MPTPITPITAPLVTNIAAPAKTATPAEGFASMLSDAVTQMDQSTKSSQSLVERYMNGDDVEIHDMVLATQRNEMQFDLFLQVRNKVVQAYQEVMRMQM